MSLTTQRGIEVHAEADAAAVLAQVLDRQPQPPRAGRPQHQPVRPLGEELFRQRLAEHLVVDAEIVGDDAALGDAGRAARLEDVDRLVLQPLGHPAAHRAAAQPFVLEQAELFEIVEALHVLARVELKRLGPLQPERRAGVGVEVPFDDLADVGVEPFAGLAHLIGGRGVGRFRDSCGHGGSSRDDGCYLGAMAYSMAPLLTYRTPLAATGGTFIGWPMSILVGSLSSLPAAKTNRSPSSTPMNTLPST